MPVDPIAAADILIVGGGMVGCGLAYQLAKRGRRPLLVERRNIASGATGRCGGMVMKIDGRDSNGDEIRKRWQYVSVNDRMLDEFERAFGDIGLWRRGSLDIACSDREMDQLAAITKMQREDLGDEEIRLLDRRQLHELSPVLSDECIGARYRPSDGCLDPFKLSHAMLREARRLGTAVMTWTTVEEILFDAQRVRGVRTDKGAIEAQTVIIAANGWAGQLCTLPIIPLRSLAVITQPAPPMPALTFEAEFHTKIIYGCTQTKRGNLLVGGPPERPGTIAEQFNEGVTLRELKTSASILPELFPGLPDLNVIRSWSGAMGTTPDGLPCVGPIEPYEGLFVAAGYPNGMSYCPVTARLLAELIVEGAPSVPLDTLDPGRFAGRTYDWPQRYDYTILAEFLARA